MTTTRILPLVAASLLSLSAVANAQTSSGGTSSGMSSPSGVSSPSSSPTASPGISSPSATTGITSPAPAPTALPGGQTTGPGAASSSGGGTAARAGGTCPPGTMTDWSVSANDPNRCKPLSGMPGSASSSSATGQPPSIMAPPTTSGAR